MDSEPNDFDRQALMKRVEGDLDLLAVIIEAFLSQLPESLAQIEASIRTRDVAALAGSSHALKGSSANFTTGTVYRTSSELEQMGRTGVWTDAEARMKKLKAEAAELEHHLRQLAVEARSGHVREKE